MGARLSDKFDYVAMSHLDRPQALTPRLAYSGRPLAQSSSEAGHDKCLLAVTLETGQEPGNVKTPIPPLPPMADLRGAFDELLELVGS